MATQTGQNGLMRLDLEGSASLRFDDGSPVRAASAIASFAGGWLIVQDDATHAAWWHGGSVSAFRVVEPVGGVETFSAAAGTKMLKPDFEAATAVTIDGSEGVLILGSGSSGARTRASLIVADEDGPPFRVAELAAIYQDVAAALGLRTDQLNLEGACVIGDRLRWFQRANVAAGAPTMCLDLSLAGLLAATGGSANRTDIGRVRHYDLGHIQQVASGGLVSKVFGECGLAAEHQQDRVAVGDRCPQVDFLIIDVAEYPGEGLELVAAEDLPWSGE